MPSTRTGLGSRGVRRAGDPELLAYGDAAPDPFGVLAAVEASLEEFDPESDGLGVLGQHRPRLLPYERLGMHIPVLVLARPHNARPRPLSRPGMHGLDREVAEHITRLIGGAVVLIELR
jgi:hypothetical protein